MENLGDFKQRLERRSLFPLKSCRFAERGNFSRVRLNRETLVNAIRREARGNGACNDWVQALRRFEGANFSRAREQKDSVRPLPAGVSNGETRDNCALHRPQCRLGR